MVLNTDKYKISVKLHQPVAANMKRVHTCTKERAAGIVAALGLFRDLARSTVEMKMSGDPAGLNGHQVSPNS